MPMLPLVPEPSGNPIVAAVFERLKKRWGTVLNLYRVLAWSPELTRSWASFAWSLRFEAVASRKLRELLIIRVGALLGARYEYEHHLKMARNEGVTAEQVAALDGWKASSLFNDVERIVLALADDLALRPGATTATMENLRAAFPERECVELLVTGAFYCGVARIVNSVQLELESHHEDFQPQEN